MAKNEPSQADQLLERLSNDLKKESSGISVFVDLLSIERLASRQLIERVLKYSLLLNIILAAVLSMVAFPKAEYHVAQQKVDGTLAELAVTGKPYYELQDIKDFAQRRATKLHSWTYKTYIQLFEDERAFWDDKPLSDYVDGLLSRGAFKSASDYRRRFEAVVPKPPKVVQQIKYEGQYRIYRVELQLQDESVGIDGVDSKIWKIVMDVREVQPKEGWAGLKVMRYDEVVVK